MKWFTHPDSPAMYVCMYVFNTFLASVGWLMEYQEMRLCLPRYTEPSTILVAEIPVLSRVPLPN